MLEVVKKLNELLEDIPCRVDLLELCNNDDLTENGIKPIVKGRFGVPYATDSIEQSSEYMGYCLLELWASSELSTINQYQFISDCRLKLQNNGIFTTQETIGKDRETSELRVNLYFNHIIRN